MSRVFASIVRHQISSHWSDNGSVMEQDEVESALTRLRKVLGSAAGLGTPRVRDESTGEIVSGSCGRGKVRLISGEESYCHMAV